MKKIESIKSLEGIIYGGEVFLPEDIYVSHCEECELFRPNCQSICKAFGIFATLRYSPELTERLKGGEK